MPNIIPTTNAEHFRAKLARKRDFKVFRINKNKDNKRYFPDGEIYLRLSRIDKINGRTIVLHSGAPNPNDGLIELFMVLEILKENKVKPVEVFFTYFPYGMQDKIFKKGETIAAELLIKKLVDYYSVKRIFIIDAHFAGRRKWIEKYPIENIPTANLLKNYAKKNFPNLIFKSPDQGAQKRTKLKGTMKVRKSVREVTLSSDIHFKNDVKGQLIGVVDDILETGGTLERFYDHAIECGAEQVIALITHGVLREGIERVKNRYLKLYLTNTVDQPEANIDITPLIIETIKK
ncbi:ribose-phosphate diphosphokinase [[Eubacterium] cellulosolvens]